MSKDYPCDGPEGFCPFDAQGGYDCRNYCGLGVDVATDKYEECEHEWECISFDGENGRETLSCKKCGFTWIAKF